MNSGRFNGLPSEEAKEAIITYLEENNWGERQVTYRLRDWLISRQRYWGTPIPIIYCDRCGTVPVPEEDLPVLLPEDIELQPGGKSPLARHESFFRTVCPVCGGSARRETDTMDTFIDSSWYFMRYVDAKNEKAPFDKEKCDAWMPVDHISAVLACHFAFALRPFLSAA